jgi:tetratricopeptide (TPR) repeat protein
MKSEHSQVQESNLLADKIEQKISQLRPYLPGVLGVIVLGILAMLGYGIYSSQREARSARAWTDFYFSDTQAQNLDAISKDYADTSAGSWARLTAGDRGMAQAMEKWNVDRSFADQRFQEAVDDYRLVVANASDPFAKSRSLFGMAQALEGLGKRTEAIEAYRQITTLSSVPAEFLAEVNQRVKWLESKDGELFFTWYTEKRTNTPVAAPNPNLPNLPSIPNLSFPPTSPSPTSASPVTPTDGATEGTGEKTETP